MVMHSENSLLVGEWHVGDYELHCTALPKNAVLCQNWFGFGVGRLWVWFVPTPQNNFHFSLRVLCSRCEGNHDTPHHRYDIPHDSQRAYDMVSHRDYTHGCFEFQTIRMILDLVQ